MTRPARRPLSRKIDWAAINFAFVLVMAILSAAMTYAYLSGSTAERIAALERRIYALEQATGRRSND